MREGSLESARPLIVERGGWDGWHPHVYVGLPFPHSRRRGGVSRGSIVGAWVCVMRQAVDEIATRYSTEVAAPALQGIDETYS